MPLHIAVVDDKPANRRMVAEKLRANPLFDVTLTASDGKDFLDKMALAEQRPSIVLMDLEMPGMDGVAAIAAGSSAYPDVKFVVLTVFDDEEKIFKAIKAGAHGYLLKEESAGSLTDALWAMHESGSGAISPGIAHRLLDLVRRGEDPRASAPPAEKTTFTDPNLFRLSEREAEILKHLASGHGYKELGALLDISPNTVKKHVIHIYEKLHVHTRAQALKLAYERGML
jgi:DNA-binding NarL/FixJ family response regulator